MRTTTLAGWLISAIWLAGCGDGSGTGSGGAGGGATTAAGGDTAAGGGGGATTAAGGDTAAGGTGGAAAPCGTFQTGNDFEVCAATYLTGRGEDTAGGADIAPDGTVVYGGSLHPDSFGLSPVSLLAGGGAGVARLSPDGRKALGVTLLGGSVSDVAVSGGSGDIAVSGDFGVAVLDPSASTVLWKASPGAAARVAAAPDGTVAALFGKTLRVFDASGAEIGSAEVTTNQAVQDIAIDSASGTVFATGFKQDDGAPCSQLQIPFLRAFGYDGAPKWKAWDWSKAEAGGAGDCADSRGYALAMGRDGALYFAGESHGGNTVFRHQPQDISASAPTVKSDPYNDPYNLNGAAPIGFYARFDPATGTMEKGQFLCTRLSSGKGNAARPRAIAADAQGNVVVAGAAACCIEGGPDRTVNGEPAMPTYAGGGFVLVVSADFQQRLQWTAFNGPLGGGANGVAAAAAQSGIVMLSQQSIDPQKNTSTTEIPLLTFDALLPSPGGGASDAWLAVMPPAP